MNKPDWSSIRMAHPQHMPPEIRDSRIEGVLFAVCVLVILFVLALASLR